MHLRDGCRGQRLLIERGEQLLDGLAERLLDDGARLGPGEGRHPVLQVG